VNTALLLVFLLLARGRASEEAPDAFVVMAELEHVASASLWPGFDPGRVPVAIFDGERTFLFRHPKPPPEFGPVAGRPGAFSHPGRHPSLRANSTVELGGVLTATLLLDRRPALPPRESAALLAHEAFHVYQSERHPAWSANEAELFLYPSDDAELLTLRRLETEALRRASGAGAQRALCWARAAMDLRRRRFVLLPTGSSAYERGAELKEGLAEYVEQRARGGPGPLLPRKGFAPEDVRPRAYAIGRKLANILDRFDPGWKERLERGNAASLDEALARALADRRGKACRLSTAEEGRMRSRAQRDIGLLEESRAGKRGDFLSRPGWTLTFSAGVEPLWPKGFDPLNVERLSGGEVLHTRWLQLGNAAAKIEILDRGALTRPAGAHPLFNGVRAVTVAGLPAEPVVSEGDGKISIQAEGVVGEVSGGRVERSGRSVKILVP
jgi:hypothetical protein